MTEREKNLLANLCGYSQERYTDKVKEGVKQSEYDRDRESAIMRKISKAMLDKIVYGIEIPQEIMEEFLIYYNTIESIKEKSKSNN